MGTTISESIKYSEKYSNQELIEALIAEEKSVLKEGRFNHCLRVAETSRYMCYLYGQDPVKGFIAGLAHDLCKSLDDFAMIQTALRDGKELSDPEKDKPSLLHGRAAAVRLQEDFGVSDPQILEAVALHTTGGRDICSLAKIVYAADKIEPGRESCSDLWRQELFSSSLDSLCLMVLKQSLDYLNRKGKKPADVTWDFYRSLEAAGGNAQ